MPRILSALLRSAGTPVLEVRGNPETVITGLVDDSRHVKPGDLFAALEGLATDGHAYVGAAVAAGATAVLHEKPLETYEPSVVYLRVPDARALLSALSRGFYGEPGRELVVIGVTGTKGKSTTTWFTAQLLEGLGKRCGFVSSASTRIGSRVEPNPLHVSTPMAYEMHRMLREMVEAGHEYAVVEASSHGLSHRTARLKDVSFDAALLTNVSHEHLDFHGTMEQYRSDKANLFRALGADPGRPTPPFGIVNLDDPSAAYFRGETRAPVLGYSLTIPEADLRALSLAETPTHTDFTLFAASGSSGIASRLNTPGPFNLSNLLAAVLTVSRLTGASVGEIAPLIPGLTPVKGRMERIDAGQPFGVIVDFAHNPDSFEKLFSTMRRLAPRRIIAVFGSAGDRDRLKRPIQGEIAGRFCEIVVLADEDPRSENPKRILKEIASGCVGHVEGQDLFLIPDRATAIRHALRLAQREDTVLLLGKAHETSIEYAGRSIPWDEARVAREALAEMGYRP